MRAAVERLLRDRTLVVVALAIALGYALKAVAEGTSYLVTSFAERVPDESNGIESLNVGFSLGSLAVRVGDRYLAFGPLLGGLIQVVVIVAAAALVYRWRDRDTGPTVADDVGEEDPRT